ncbi:hypothetical protein [Subtercola sp. RTI3]|uniref:hypothetical protein n=1 Tax=Subtercola sp. RTI3 TaxID=3048639 RepID=UPI002B2294D9|nr:hypothetical protein [Subtercola sp. RTI3]MEA9986367.1 hypothetical protein [Subtercola sp. RTI3]
MNTRWRVTKLGAATIAVLVFSAFGLASAGASHAAGVLSVTTPADAGTVFYSSSDTAFDVLIAGQAEPGVAVTVTLPGGTLCTTGSLGDGSWQCTITSAPDFSGDATISSGLGDSMTFAVGFLNPPVLSPAEAAGLVTTDAAQVVSGTAFPGSPVVVSLSPTPASGSGCTTTADPSGAFSCALALTDADAGTHSLSATQRPFFAEHDSAPSPDVSLEYEPAVVVTPIVPVVPVTPVTPVVPVTPVTPVTPVVPVNPVMPVAPASPVDPVTPVTPTAPNGAVAPVTPIDPVTPVVPQTPALPLAPVLPVTPLSPAAAPAPVDTPAPTVPPTPAVTASPLVPRAGGAPVGGANALAGAVGSANTSAPAGAGASSAAGTGTVLGAATALVAWAGGGWADPGWGQPTRFGTSLQPVSSVPFGQPAFIAGLVALAGVLVLLLALPAELLQSTVRENYERIAERFAPARWWQASTQGSRWRARFTGWRAQAALLISAAVITTFADPTTGFDVRTVRLAVALTVVLVVVNYSVMAVTQLHATRVHGATTRMALRPLALLLLVLSVAVSRGMGMQPGLLFGLVLGIEVGERLGRAAEAKVTIVVAALLVTLGGGSWLVYSALNATTPAPATFGAQLLNEVLGGLAAECLSALVIALLPLTFLDGKAIFEWSKLLWLVVYAAASGVFVIVLLPSSWVQLPSVFSPWALVLAGFTALSLAAWAYFRWHPEALGMEPDPESQALPVAAEGALGRVNG